MPRRSDAPPVTRGVVVRSVVFVLAIALGAVAVWLIVTSTTQKRIELGILAGLWGLLLGTFSVLGSRRVANPSSVEASHPNPGAEVELRSAAALERSEDAKARREYEARLERMLREEVRETMGRELAGLRAEIAQLRGELLEKVGGQLRLERIETTRLIGSDLEALQDEVRKLKTVSPAEELGVGFSAMPAVASLERIVEHSAVPAAPMVQRAAVSTPVEVTPVETPVEVTPVEEPPEPVRVSAMDQTAPLWPRSAAPATSVPPAEPPPAEPEPAEPEPVGHKPAEPTPASPAVEPSEPVEPVAVAEPAPLPVPEPEPFERAPAASAPSGSTSMFDDLASLPRLRPFTEFELDPIPSSPPSHHGRAEQAGSAGSAPAGYSGRRRRQEDEPTHSPDARHASTGRRHRRAADGDATDDTDHDDLLARLLARESVR